MRAQWNCPVNRVSTDVCELEEYLRQAAEYATKTRGSAHIAGGAATTKGQIRAVLTRKGVKRRITNAHRKTR